MYDYNLSIYSQEYVIIEDSILKNKYMKILLDEVR